MALAVVAGLLYALWPSGSNGPGGSGDGSHSVSASHVSPAEQGSSAAQALGELPAVDLSLVYAPAEHRSVTRANIAVASTGQASGVLTEPVAGKSSLAWSGDQLYLNGDPAFWAQQDPQFGHDVTSSNHWVAPEKRDGYYMLDGFGVNAGSLTPASLATLVRQVTSDPEAAREDGTYQGHPAVAYTAQDWTVVLNAQPPYAVLAIGGDPSHQSAIQPAVWQSTPATRQHTAVTNRATAVPADDRDYGSYLLLEPKPGTATQAATVRTAVASAVAVAVPPATAAEAVSTAMGPEFTITNNSGYLCTTNPCPYSFTVTNSGDQPGAATLYLTLPKVPDQPHPLGTLQPKQSRTVTGTRPNIAPTGETVTHTDYAWVYSSATYGADPAVGSRLHARNLRPEDLSVGTPLKPTAAKLLDLMTKDLPASDTEAGSQAVDALEDANGQGELPDLGAIVDSGRLSNPEDLRDLLPTTDTVENQRVLQQIALLLQTDPQAHVTWNAPSTPDGAPPPADYLYTSTEQGRPVKRAVQTENTRNPAELGSQARAAVAQLNGRQPNSGATAGHTVPSGYERVLRLDFEPFVGPLLDLASTPDLQHSLASDPRFQQLRDALCEPHGGGPSVDRIVVVNASGTHQWTDPSQLGAHCGSSPSHTPLPTPPASAAPSPGASPPPSAGPVRCGRNGWDRFRPVDPAHGNRAQGVTACLNKGYLAAHTGSPARFVPPGYRWAQTFATGKGLVPPQLEINNCHLLGKQLGGSGSQRENMSPCARGANFPQEGSAQGTNTMYAFEKQVKDAIAADQDVLYTVTPEYQGNRTVPTGYQMSARGTKPDGSAGISIGTTVPNTLRTGDNLGTQSDGSGPVPSGSTP